ncbi:MAG: aldehyde dehydrogenase family protein [Planctomycetota bacterium]
MQTIEDRNPATGELIATIPCAGPEEVRAAVARARAAQPGWAALPGEERRRRVLASLEVFRELEGELADTITREMGKPRRNAAGEVQGYLSGIERETAEVLEALAPQRFDTGETETTLVRMPHGVVAAITPWNFPIGMPLSILIPALMAGNTVVFKPSEHVPLTGALIHKALSAHLGPDVLVLLQGDGRTGAALVDSDVDMIGFVGSRATGQHIMRAAAGGLKRLVLELGGKDPLIVFADADLEKAADCAVQHSVRNSGQVCCSVERVYVAEAVRERFEQLVLDRIGAWTYEGPEAPLGPMVSPGQREVVHGQVQEAVAQGARLLAGGRLPEGPGSFYPATVLADLRPEHRVLVDETFGPVVALATFSGEEAEAIRLANDTPYGLGANVWTGDRERGLRVAQAIVAGQVGVNRYLAGAQGSPWVGARGSGFGFLGGPEGHRQFTVPKTIGVAPA